MILNCPKSIPLVRQCKCPNLSRNSLKQAVAAQRANTIISSRQTLAKHYTFKQNQACIESSALRLLTKVLFQIQGWLN